LGKWPELMRRWAIPGAIAVVAVAALAVWLLRTPAVEVTSVVRRDVLQTVVASGRVAAPFRVDIGSQITGTVSSVPVAEGQLVKAGDTIVQRGTNHAWSNRSDAPCVVAFVLIDGEF